MIFLSMLLFEAAFRILVFDLPINARFIRVAYFSLAYSAIIFAFLRFFNEQYVKIILFIILFGMGTFYFSQNIYYVVMDGFFSFNMVSDAGRGFGFLRHLVSSLRFVHIIYFVPLLLLIQLLRKHKYFRNNPTDLFTARYGHIRAAFATIALALFLTFSSLQTIDSEPLSAIKNTFNYSERDLYDTNFSPQLTINRFGLFTYARADIRNMFNVSEPSEETDEWVVKYLADRAPHETNDKTGFFEDKNFIMIVVESLDTYAVDPSLMPNYYAMLENSMIFDNYYAPLYTRNTADTEFMLHTSFYPNPRVGLSMNDYVENVFPNTLPQMFIDKGYDTMAFHNYSDFYYPRSRFHTEAMGFDYYKDAFDMGLVDEEDYDIENDPLPWLSDLNMFENTLDEILAQDKFFAYYLTLSGHLPYDETHETAEKNIETIREIFADEGREPVDEAMMYFHAAHYEFDLALGYLLEKLEETGQADDTVVMVVSDHFAYGLERDLIADYDETKNLEETYLNIHNVPMSIYHPQLEKTHFSQIASSIDMMPTIANLFSLDMDYQYAMGYDAFGATKSVVRFRDSSFMHQNYFLEASRDLNITITDGAYTEDDVLFSYNYLIHQFQINLYILETDYFNPDRPESEK